MTCWATGCSGQTVAKAHDPWVPLLEPVETCSPHLGDLLGNMAKAQLAANPTKNVTLQVTPL